MLLRADSCCCRQRAVTDRVHFRSQKNLCGAGFSLYIRGSPHQARESFKRSLVRVFLSPWNGHVRSGGGVCLKENAYD
jgi:hypothetical protein